MYRVIRPLFWTFEPETAHNLAIKLIKLGFLGLYKSDIPSELEVSVSGLSFPSPVGLAAGFDKNAEIFHVKNASGSHTNTWGPVGRYTVPVAGSIVCTHWAHNSLRGSFHPCSLP